jgi:hypothetical protein
MTGTVTPHLEFLPPETVRFGSEKVRTGGQMWRGLKRLLHVQPGATGVRRVSLAAWVRAVWGEDRGPVRPSTLRGLVFRTNELLGALGCPATLSKRADPDGTEWITLE